MNYEQLFHRATKGRNPYPYQITFSESATLPKVLNVPTGVGKTATVILGWLYRRLYSADVVKGETPRRLVYCLPMRTLVEQTKQVASEWLANLEIADQVGVHLLMGGTDAGDWDVHPEREAILIGTQDMMLSRALNRGYGMSRYRWPVQYALLNNDCLWVLDETQLMGVGLTTSVQLAGFREKLPVAGRSHTLWMSATLDREALVTVDHPAESIVDLSDVHTLTDSDRKNEHVNRLLLAKKPLEQCAVSLNANDEITYAQEIAKAALSATKSVAKSLTLVIVNRVQRAQAIYVALRNLVSNSEGESPEVHVIHSRYRKSDRDRTQEAVLNEENIPQAGRIVVSTQAIEAGVDISATTLFTELAPWSSLVQRFGRCNRRGECHHARVLWIDIKGADEKKTAELTLPYATNELAVAREHLKLLNDVGPHALEHVKHQEPQPIVHTLRRKDLLELWDTTPDLAGNDLDVSRYIRDSDDTDVQVYWREWAGKRPPDDPKQRNEAGELVFPEASSEELCAVSVFQFKNYIKTNKSRLKKLDCDSFLRWNPLQAQWETVGQNDVRPGNIILLHCTAGGYDAKLGWTGDRAHRSTAVDLDQVPSVPEAAYDDDALGSQPVELSHHLRRVAMKAERIQHLADDQGTAIVTAALWHDVGKVHAAFQNAVRNSGNLLADTLWAKSGGRGRLTYTMSEIDTNDGQQSKRPGFRHELASALAWLAAADGQQDADLIAFLIAAHHGKVRGSIRSLPTENRPRDSNQHFARGIWDGDVIPSVDLGNGERTPEVVVDLSLMELGDYEDRHGNSRPSWRTRVAGVLEEYGPFQLAYLEMLVRIADWRGSSEGGTT